MPFSSIAQHELRCERAADFVKMFQSDNSGTGVTTNDNHLYTFIGREDDPAGLQVAVASNGSYTATDAAFASSAGLWPDDEAPPTITRAPEEVREFWSMAIGAKKVSPADINLVIPRVNWTTATQYASIDLADETWYSAGDYYVLNSANEVWLCLHAPAAVSVDEPIFSGTRAVDGAGGLEFYRDGTESIQTTADDYVWKYLYSITPALAADFLLDDWMPVPCTVDSLWPSGDERTEGRDDAYMLLGARHVLIRSELDSGADGTGKLPAGLRYRQVALVKNPCGLKAAPTNLLVRVTGPIYYQTNSVNGVGLDPNQLEPFVGDVLYLENRSPISREVNQTEEFKTILVF